MSLTVRAEACDLVLPIGHPKGHLDSEVSARQKPFSGQDDGRGIWIFRLLGYYFWDPVPSMTPRSCQLGPPVVVASGPLLELSGSLAQALLWAVQWALTRKTGNTSQP